MRRRSFVTATLAAATLPTLARAQETEPPAAETPALAGDAEAPAAAETPAAAAPAGPQLIEPTNALEYAFVSALGEERMRPIFRRYLMDTHVALALTSEDADAPVREVDVRDGFRAGAVFTSSARVDEVLGADAPRIMINGRAALERLRDKNVVINYRLLPMLTLEPADVARYLETPGSASAGPSQ
jgi:hypothetical protein